MKKRMIITDCLISFFSLVLFFIISLITISKINFQNNKKELKNYLDIANNVFDGNNGEELIDTFQNNKELRVTVIDSNGKVLFDNNIDSIEENHLKRPEIINLKKIYYRYSDTLNMKMLYIASFDNGYYIRIAIPQSSIDNFISSYLLYGILAIIVLFSLSIFVITRLLKKAFIPLREQVNKLSRLANEEDNVIGDDINVLQNRIDEVGSIIEQKIITIDKEKDKLRYILDNTSNGLIVINSDSKVEIINSTALNILCLQIDTIINNDYVYLSRSIDLIDKIDQARKDNVSFEYQEEIDNNYYLIRIKSLDNLWNQKQEYGVLISYSDITEIKQLEKSKKEFFANASHELKSPLTSIIGYQQMIKEGVLSEKDEINDAISRTINESKRMDKIIIEMLALSKLENNYPTVFSDIRIKDLANDIIDSYKNELEQANIKLKLDIKDDIIQMDRLDATMLFKNLFENAIKYNKNGGIIEIVFNKFNLIVKDTGIGISKDNIEHVFERFFRVDKIVSKSKNGTGLGLAIVKHICLNYNYKVSIESHLNEGTKVNIKFLDD